MKDKPDHRTLHIAKKLAARATRELAEIIASRSEHPVFAKLLEREERIQELKTELVQLENENRGGALDIVNGRI